MKNFLFKLILKVFGDQVIDYFIADQMPIYKISKTDTATLEKLADLYISPEWKILVNFLSNKKNFLGKFLLRLKYKNKEDCYIQHATVRGQAYEITYLIKFVKYCNKIYQKRNNKNGNN